MVNMAGWPAPPGARRLHEPDRASGFFAGRFQCYCLSSRDGSAFAWPEDDALWSARSPGSAESFTAFCLLYPCSAGPSCFPNFSSRGRWVKNRGAALPKEEAYLGERSEEHTSELQSRQYLHSFPTRRSSDLPGMVRPSPGPRTMPSGALAPRAQLSRSQLFVSSTLAPLVHLVSLTFPLEVDGSKIEAPPSPKGKRTSGRDRKSTRLNSSHANIYTLSLHDALPIFPGWFGLRLARGRCPLERSLPGLS